MRLLDGCGYRQCWALRSLHARPGDARIHKLFEGRQAVGRSDDVWPGRTSEKSEKMGLRTLRGEWRTAGERGGVAEQSGAQEGDPSSVDPEGCLIWPRLRNAEARGSQIASCRASREPMIRGGLRQTCSLWERAEDHVFSTRAKACARWQHGCSGGGGGTCASQKPALRSGTLGRIAISCACFGEVQVRLCTSARCSRERRPHKLWLCAASQRPVPAPTVRPILQTHNTRPPAMQPP